MSSDAKRRGRAVRDALFCPVCREWQEANLHASYLQALASLRTVWRAYGQTPRPHP